MNQRFAEVSYETKQVLAAPTDYLDHVHFSALAKELTDPENDETHGPSRTLSAYSSRLAP